MNTLRVLKIRNTRDWQMLTGTQKDGLLGIVQERLFQASPPPCKVLALLTPAVSIVLNYLQTLPWPGM